MAKPRAFLVPIALAVAALIRPQEAPANSRANDAAAPQAPTTLALSGEQRQEQEAVQTISYELGSDLFEFVINKGGDGTLIAAHRSHRSHASHRSHRSHYSGR